MTKIIISIIGKKFWWALLIETVAALRQLPVVHPFFPLLGVVAGCKVAAEHDKERAQL
jgi:hypothetical protein